MKAADYRIESRYAIFCRLLPLPRAADRAFSDGALAVAMAAKSVTVPLGGEIRVVHVPTGEIIFRKSAPELAISDEA